MGCKIHKTFRITEEQEKHMETQCERYGINASEYIRRLIDADRGKQISVPTQEEFLIKKQMVYEVNRIGNNINQIVNNSVFQSHYNIQISESEICIYHNNFFAET